ncbi:FUSC family protein [Salibacterium aidingense]|uniref:FUSC family protein n=1 Tax=Salibacterium aidingense TaxID=384933 RepID=UPI003BE0730C
MKLGARIFKTGLAIIIAIYAASWAGLDPSFFAAISATFAIQPSIYRSYQTIVEQIQANVIGAVIAVVFALTFGYSPVLIGAAVMLAISIILKLKLESSAISLALVTIIIIMGNPADGFLLFAAERFSLVMLGVLSAFVVNLLFLPPKHETKLYYKISDLTEEVIRWTRLITRHETNQPSLKKDIPRINESLIKLDNLYLLFKEERSYFRKSKLGKARKLVLFKQLIVALKKIFSILKTFDKYENELSHIPEPMQKHIKAQLDHLMDYHDRILLRYVGKVNTQLTKDMEEEVAEGKFALTDLFMNLYENQEMNRDEWYHVLPVVAHIIEYNEQLEHLDRLVESFFSYHQEDNTVQID